MSTVVAAAASTTTAVTATSPPPSAQAPVPPPDVQNSAQAEIVASALQALKENGLPSNMPEDPHIVAALLSLLQSQKPPAADQVTKEAAAETLSNLSHAGAPNPAQDPNIHPQLQDAGPSTHPHGPPSLGHGHPAEPDGPASHEANDLPPDSAASMVSVMSVDPSSPAERQSRRRANGPPTVNGIIMGSEEWTRQRKDNHKEVERRRRGNINEGINELARIVPNGTGEKAKGAILSRSVQYIHHLKENEARNIEKWTLEKLLMDQAMGDLQAQLDDARARVQEETVRKEEAESHLALAKSEIESLKAEVLKARADDSSSSSNSNKRPRTDA